jgi:hypothetical protein
MNEMGGSEHNAAGVRRRLLLGAGLLGATVIAGGAARAAEAGWVFCGRPWSQQSVTTYRGIGEPVDVSRVPTDLRPHARRDDRR